MNHNNGNCFEKPAKFWRKQIELALYFHKNFNDFTKSNEFTGIKI